MNTHWPFPTRQSQLEADAFRQIFRDLKQRGKLCSPRGQLCLELEHHTYELPPYARFCNFEARKLNLNYIKNEFLWYLRGDKYDTSIGEKAKLWQSLVNADGSINSNYGQYLFGQQNQFDNVVRTLTEDRDSRRASAVILNRDHLTMQTKDVPCTYSLNFRIREGKLNMSVHMRSQDAIFGMGNDAPCFSFIHEMVLAALRSNYEHEDLELGTYKHTADSLHVYERHFEMLDKLVDGDPHSPVSCPQISGLGELTLLRSWPTGFHEVGALPEDEVRVLREDGFNFLVWLYEEVK